MKQYRLIKFWAICIYRTNDKGEHNVFAFSTSCQACPHYRGTSGKRVKCAWGIDDKRRVM